MPYSVSTPQDPEPSAEETDDDAPADLGPRLAGLESGLREIGRQLAAAAERAAARERVIDRQHAEIERLRAEQRGGQLRPTVVDLCRLRNDLLRQAETLPVEMTGRDVADLLRSYADTVEEALERCGVVVARPQVGAAFVPGRQQVVAVVATDEPERDGTVAWVVQDGYEDLDGAVVAPGRIEVHRRVTTEKEGTDG